MKEKERIDYLDVAKGIGILLVVIGHIEYVSEPVRQYIVSFHMPLFFLISGMLIYYREEQQREWPELISKKITGIMIPYGVFSGLYFVIEAVRLLVRGLDEWGSVFRQLYQSLCLQGVSTLWFLPALFMGELIFIWIRKNSSHVQTLWCLAALFVALYFINIDVQSFFTARSDSLVLSLLYDIISMLLRNIFCAGLVGLGYYAGILLFKKNLPAVLEMVLALFFFVLVGKVAGWNQGVDLRSMTLGNLGLYLLGGAGGFLGVIFLCRAVVRLPLKRVCGVFEYFGRNTLLIMATHMELRILYISIKLAALADAVVQKNALHSVLIVVLVFLMEIVVIEFVNRGFPFLLRKLSKSS